MGMIFSIWGKNGSGKSTVASNLACAFSKRGYMTAIVGANRFYGAIQYYYNISISAEQSLRVLLSGDDSMSIQDYFIICPSDKNIHIASLADGEDCAGYRKLRVDMVVRFLNLVKNNYPIVLIDCDESIDDPLSMYSLTMSEKIVYVTRPTLQSVIFAKAYESIVSGLQVKEQMTVAYVAGAASSATISEDAGLYSPFGITKGYRFLPYCQEIESPSDTAAPIIYTRGRSRAAINYSKEIIALADMLADSKGMDRATDKGTDKGTDNGTDKR